MMAKPFSGAVYREGYYPRYAREYYELYNPVQFSMDMGMDSGSTVEIDEKETALKIGELLKKPARSSKRGVYIHIPFCRSRCSYCPFYRYPVVKDIPRFVEATVAMLEKLGHTPYVSSRPFDTFFFGGGTPTALPLTDLERILSTLLRYFKPSEGHEFTVESTITNISPELLSLLKQYRVNRISLGVQTFDTHARRKLGRHADRKQIILAMAMSLQAGMRTNVDLMYALPGQTVEDFVEQVRTACQLGVDNMSHYRMKLFPDAPLQKAIDTGRSVPQPSRAEWTDMQLAGWDEAERHGYHRWNSKNFGRTETESCRYAFKRYSPTDLVPTGCGGFGRIGLVRFRTDEDLNAYCQQIQDGRLPFADATIGNMDALYLEKLRGLLQQKELDLSELGSRFGVDVRQLHQETLNELATKGLIQIDGDKVRLTRLGVVWWPEIAPSFKVEPGAVQISYDDLSVD